MGDSLKESVTRDGNENSAELPPAKVKKSGGCLRFLLLLLLLVVAMGGGFYYFALPLLFPEEEPVAVSASPRPSKMKVPTRTKPVVTEKVPEEVVTKEEVAAVKPPAPPAAVSAPVVPEVKPEPKPAFALTSGSYLYHGALARAEKILKDQGYEVSSSEQPEEHEVTRLLAGRFDKSQAQKRLAELRQLAPDAFLVAEEGLFAVYVGSYLSLDKARRTADLLYQEGVRVDEVQVKVSLPKTRLRFGQFVTRKEAETAAAKLKKLGVEDPQIVSLN